MNEWGSARIPFFFMIDFSCENTYIFPLEESNKYKILYDINGKTNFSENVFPLNKKIEFEKFPISFEEYSKRFFIVKSEIQKGNTYLLNLTCPTKIRINLSPKEIFLHSSANYKLFLEDNFVVFSPESFVKIQDNIVSSYPMKGTIDADIKEAAQQIMEDAKEKAEHNTIVDLIRNDLNSVAAKIRVEQFRYPEIIRTNQKNILQISSKIGGDMKHGWESKIGDIFMKLLPAGSICGAPKKKTVEIINDVEKYNRGFYTGVFGIFDGKNVDSGVMIRFIEITKSGLIYKSGGGITMFSEAEKEYQEMIDKVYVPII